MKKIVCLVLLSCGLSMGCKAFRSVTDTTKTSQGAPYELIVVIDQPLWEGDLGTALRETFQAPIPYLMEEEPHFTMMRVPDTSYKGLIADHRNILKVLVDPSVEVPEVGVRYNVTAAPQIVATLQGPTAAALTQFVSLNRETLAALFEAAERDRSIAFARQFNQPEHEKLIREMFGVEMHVPQGYVLAQRSDDFVWFRYEFPTASQGFMLYSYPYEGAEAIDEASLLEARNRFVKRVPGPSDGSYMTTATVFAPQYRMFRLEGRLWFEMRGFWDVEGDFMGGPFVSYTTIDTTTNRVLTLDTYVFSPKQPKRNYLRETEHLLYLMHFPVQP